MKNLRVAVLLPCYNEAAVIAQVVKNFQTALPNAVVYVYDNNSTDDTYQKAKEAGAVVYRELSQGKGHVVRRMFANIDADIYIMADGDGTYDHTLAPHMIDLLVDTQLDMVIAQRKGQEGAYRMGHQWGNYLFNWLLKKLFKSDFQDIFSGYRVFSRRFVKSFPALSSGFDVETELSVHALELGLAFCEIPSVYAKRSEGTESKLRTYIDGFKILMRIVSLFKHQRPFLFFGLWSALSAVISITLFIPVWETYHLTGLVPRLPTVVLCAALIILSIIFITCGLVLDSLSYTRTILKRLHYLNSPGLRG